VEAGLLNNTSVVWYGEPEPPTTLQPGLKQLQTPTTPAGTSPH
jgi:hypothetical protein